MGACFSSARGDLQRHTREAPSQGRCGPVFNPEHVSGSPAAVAQRTKSDLALPTRRTLSLTAATARVHGDIVARLVAVSEGDALPVLGREVLSRELQGFPQPVAVLYVDSVNSGPCGAVAGKSPQSQQVDHLSTFGSLTHADTFAAALPASAMVRESSEVGRPRLVFGGEPGGGGGGISVSCVLTNAAAVGALQLKDEQDILTFLARSFAKDPGLHVLFQDIVRRLLQGQLSTVSHFVPGDFGRGRYFLSLRISPFLFNASGDSSGVATGGMRAAPAGREAAPGPPQPPPGGGGVHGGGCGAGGEGVPAFILELDVPYEGKDLAARLQRDYMITSHVPSIVTMFDPRGRILHQNRSSVAYLGYLVGLDRNAAAAAAAVAASRARASTATAGAAAGAAGGSRQIQAPPRAADGATATPTGAAAGPAGGVGSGPGGGMGDRAASGSGWHQRTGASLTVSLGASTGARTTGGGGGPNRLQQLFAHDPTKLQEILRAVAEGMEWRGLVRMPARLGDPELLSSTPAAHNLACDAPVVAAAAGPATAGGGPAVVARGGPAGVGAGAAAGAGVALVGALVPPLVTAAAAAAAAAAEADAAARPAAVSQLPLRSPPPAIVALDKRVELLGGGGGGGGGGGAASDTDHLSSLFTDPMGSPRATGGRASASCHTDTSAITTTTAAGLNPGGEGSWAQRRTAGGMGTGAGTGTGTGTGSHQTLSSAGVPTVVCVQHALGTVLSDELPPTAAAAPAAAAAGHEGASPVAAAAAGGQAAAPGAAGVAAHGHGGRDHQQEGSPVAPAGAAPPGEGGAAAATGAGAADDADAAGLQVSPAAVLLLGTSRCMQPPSLSRLHASSSASSPSHVVALVDATGPISVVAAGAAAAAAAAGSSPADRAADCTGGNRAGTSGRSGETATATTTTTIGDTVGSVTVGSFARAVSLPDGAVQGGGGGGGGGRVLAPYVAGTSSPGTTAAASGLEPPLGVPHQQPPVDLLPAERMVELSAQLGDHQQAHAVAGPARPPANSPGDHGQSEPLEAAAGVSPAAALGPAAAAAAAAAHGHLGSAAIAGLAWGSSGSTAHVAAFGGGAHCNDGVASSGGGGADGPGVRRALVVPAAVGGSGGGDAAGVLPPSSCLMESLMVEPGQRPCGAEWPTSAGVPGADLGTTSTGTGTGTGTSSAAMGLSTALVGNATAAGAGTREDGDDLLASNSTVGFSIEFNAMRATAIARGSSTLGGGASGSLHLPLSHANTGGKQASSLQGPRDPAATASVVAAAGGGDCAARGLTYIDEEANDEGAEELSFLLPRIASSGHQCKPPAQQGQGQGQGLRAPRIPEHAAQDAAGCLRSRTSTGTGAGASDAGVALQRCSSPQRPLPHAAATAAAASSSSAPPAAFGAAGMTPAEVVAAAAAAAASMALPSATSAPPPGLLALPPSLVRQAAAVSAAVAGGFASASARLSAPTLDLLPNLDTAVLGSDPLLARARQSAGNLPPGQPSAAGQALASVTSNDSRGGGPVSGAAAGVRGFSYSIARAEPRSSTAHQRQRSTSTSTTYLHLHSQEQGRRLHAVLRGLSRGGGGVSGGSGGGGGGGGGGMTAIALMSPNVGGGAAAYGAGSVHGGRASSARASPYFARTSTPVVLPSVPPASTTSVALVPAKASTSSVSQSHQQQQLLLLDSQPPHGHGHGHGHGAVEVWRQARTASADIISNSSAIVHPASGPAPVTGMDANHCPSAAADATAAPSATALTAAAQSAAHEHRQGPLRPQAQAPQAHHHHHMSTGTELTTMDAFRWHEVHVKPCFDPMSPNTSEPLIMVIQTDVTSKVRAEEVLARVLEAEHRLLNDIFPSHVVRHMTQRRRDEAELERNGLQLLTHIQDPAALATSHECVTVLFADIKGFTDMSKEVPAATVMTFLNDLYTRFDSLTDVYGVYKVETIGDCYMVAGGLVAREEDGYGRAVRGQGNVDPLHAMRVVAFARAMLEEAGKVLLPTTKEPVKMRVGIHSGPATSGVVGHKMPRFCLFGDTVNTASRMESTGRPGVIHASAATRGLLPPEEDEEGWAPTGGVDVKGKGVMQTYTWSGADKQRRDKQQRAMLLGTLSSLTPAIAAIAAGANSRASPPSTARLRQLGGGASGATAAVASGTLTQPNSARVSAFHRSASTALIDTLG